MLTSRRVRRGGMTGVSLNSSKTREAVVPPFEDRPMDLVKRPKFRSFQQNAVRFP